MTEETRRAIAYIAGRLRSESDAVAVLDLATGRHTWFEGEVGSKIAVYDHSRNCLIGGSPRALYDAGVRRHLNLEMSGDSFTGFDHGCNHHFGGRIEGDHIWIFDCEPERRFTYALVTAVPAPEQEPAQKSAA